MKKLVFMIRILALDNISISKRIISVLLALVILLSVSTAIFISKLFTFNNKIDEIYHTNFVGLNAISKISIGAETQFGVLAGIPSIMDRNILQKAREAFDFQSQTIDYEISEYKKKKPDEKISAVLDSITKQNVEFREKANKVIELTASFAQDQALKKYQDEILPIILAEKSALEGITITLDVETQTKIEGMISSSKTFLKVFSLIILIVTSVISALSFFIATRISSNLKKLSEEMTSVSNGDLSTEISFSEQKDEIGSMARTLLIFKNGALEKERLQKQQKEAGEKAKKDLDRMNDISNKFENQVQVMLDSVSSAAAELTQVSESMGENISDVDSKVKDATTASNTTSSNVNSVASASEEMAASVKEISSQIIKSTEVVNDAVKKAANAESSAKSLEQASMQIGSIVKLISDIASQINLLALNATIESARAGEAGKGFAVVASEVKKLATETTKATEDISSQIEGMQGISTEVSESLNAIKMAIDKVNEYSNGISAAVEEQSATTNEISRNMQTAATGTDEVSNNILRISDLASHAKNSSTQMLDASRMLSKEAEQLSSVVKSFLRDVRKN